MGKLFDTWLVHDQHDFRKLRDLCHDLRLSMPHVIITPLDLPQHYIPESHQIPSSAAASLLHFIQCTAPQYTPAVMNQLIDGVRLPQPGWGRHSLNISGSHISLADCLMWLSSWQASHVLLPLSDVP